MPQPLKALYNDSRVLPLADEAPARVLRGHVRDLLRALNTCFAKNNFNLHDINHEMNKINNDIRTLAYLNVAPPLIAKLRNEVGGIDKMANRVDVIIRTDFIPAAYALAEIATGSVILILLFVKMDPPVRRNDHLCGDLKHAHRSPAPDPGYGQSVRIRGPHLCRCRSGDAGLS